MFFYKSETQNHILLLSGEGTGLGIAVTLGTTNLSSLVESIDNSIEDLVLLRVGWYKPNFWGLSSSDVNQHVHPRLSLFQIPFLYIGNWCCVILETTL